MFIWIPLFPLLGAAANGVFGIRYFSRRAVHTIGVGTVGLSFLLSALSFTGWTRSAVPYVVTKIYSWVPRSLIPVLGGRPASVSFDFALRYDSLAAVMTLVVTGVGLLIHVYSVGYMAREKSYARYFAYLNLFTFAMLLLVLAANLAVMFIGWEGVGLCSYLLIGFWFTRDAAANAGKKAFITNRVGDFGVLLGIGLLVSSLGTVDTAEISALVGRGALGRGTATAAALLLFLGAIGKSAQIPLYTWLPDAMEGPTPVSALIHAATMVTAGVYMVARLNALFSFSGTALTVVAYVGALTAVYAATLGLVQHDIKRVLAYSTISQIGYMFGAAGVGAFGAGIFHLLTHAFFKSLLFLGAGSVIHALSGEQDMRKMGGLRASLPKTFPALLVAALAISGVPGFSGFFSKDEILASAFAARQYGIWALGILGAGLTAFYVFRLIFLVFYGKERFDGEVKTRLHESPRIMTVPLQILALLSILGGYVGLPRVLGGGHWFGAFLESSTGPHRLALSGGTEIVLMLLSAAVGLGGIWAAHFVYIQKEGRPAERFSARFRTIVDVVRNKYYVDEFYNTVVVRGVLRMGRLLHWFDDHVIDGLVNGTAALVRRASRLSIGFDQDVIDGAVNGIGSLNRLLSSGLRRLQSGFVYNYALSIVIGIVILISLLVTLF